MQTQCTTLQSMYIAGMDAFQHDDAAQQEQHSDEQRSGVTLRTVRERAEHNAKRLYDLTEDSDKKPPALAVGRNIA